MFAQIIKKIKINLSNFIETAVQSVSDALYAPKREYVPIRVRSDDRRY